MFPCVYTVVVRPTACVNTVTAPISAVLRVNVDNEGTCVERMLSSEIDVILDLFPLTNFALCGTVDGPINAFVPFGRSIRVVDMFWPSLMDWGIGPKHFKIVNSNFPTNPTPTY